MPTRKRAGTAETPSPFSLLLPGITAVIENARQGEPRLRGATKIVARSIARQSGSA
jgi:hypothetical protein